MYKTTLLIGLVLISSLTCGCMGKVGDVTITEIDSWYEIHSVQLHYTGSEWYSIHYIDDGELCMLKLWVDHRPLNDPTTQQQPYPTLHRGVVYHTEGDAKLHIVRRIDANRGMYRQHHYLEVKVYIPDKLNIDVGDDQYTSGRSTRTATGRTIYTEGI